MIFKKSENGGISKSNSQAARESGVILFLFLFALILPLGASFGAYQKLTHRSTTTVSHRRGGLSFLSMGMKVNIRIVGRKSGSEPWLDDACEMYLTRLLPSTVEVETTWHKENQALTKGVDSDSSKGHTVVLLDPLGMTRTSEKFSDDLFEWLDRGGSRLSFVIGGAEGLPSEIKYPSNGKKPTMISLSSMTFTHQFARLLLIEQIYRGTEIRKGSGYHK
jgi:23S rRNA (pseudouridine1915-N3)-methyltransferase